jgi:hypothetical protein
MSSLSQPLQPTSLAQTRFAEALANQNYLTNLLNSLGDVIATLKGALASGPNAFTPGAIANGAQASNAVAVAGAAMGDMVEVSYDAALNGVLTVSGYVSSAGNVTFVLSNNSGAGITPTAGNWRAVVLPKANYFATLATLAGGLASLATT